jgi:formylglycine-generating enzyme required for sulfatase activity
MRSSTPVILLLGATLATLVSACDAKPKGAPITAPGSAAAKTPSAAATTPPASTKPPASGGSSDLPAVLLDHEAWKKADEKTQDLAISAIAKRLGEAFRFVRTERYRCDPFEQRIATFTHVASGARMNLIPGGSYTMGAANELGGPPTEPATRSPSGPTLPGVSMAHLSSKARPRELPAHTVTIRPFLIGATELSQGAWDKIGGDDKRRWRSVSLPIEMVSWSSAKAWLAKAGGGLRFPSESEWEYACRASSTLPFGFGPFPKSDAMWLQDNSKGRTKSITKHRAQTNAFGLSDMHGNISEWCQDSWVGDYKSGPNDEAPRGQDSDVKKVTRGGSYNSKWQNATSSYRYYLKQDQRSTTLGLRVARGL